MHFVYIIYSEKINKYYIGQTVNVPDRLFDHNAGKYHRAYSRRAADWILILSVQCETKTQAIQIERHLKKMKSRTYIENLIRFPEIVDNLKLKYQQGPGSSR